jgi:hypothetical protein
MFLDVMLDNGDLVKVMAYHTCNGDVQSYPPSRTIEISQEEIYSWTR